MKPSYHSGEFLLNPVSLWMCTVPSLVWFNITSQRSTGRLSTHGTHCIFPGSLMWGSPMCVCVGGASGFYPACYNTDLRFRSPELVDQKTVCLARQDCYYMKQTVKSCRREGTRFLLSNATSLWVLTHRLSPPNIPVYSVPAHRRLTARDGAVALIQAHSRLLRAVAPCPLGSLPPSQPSHCPWCTLPNIRAEST